MRKLALYLTVVMLVQSCATTTVITSNIPESEVYIGGKLKGTTPYRHKDWLPLGAQRKIEIKKEGYTTVKDRIGKFDRLNGMAFFGGFVAIAPFLWSGTYKHYYQYELIKAGESSPIKSDYVQLGTPFSTIKGYAAIYIGEDNSNHYIYNQNKLHVLSSDMSLQETVELPFKSDRTPIDAYVQDGQKNVMVFDHMTNELSVLRINASNKTQQNGLQEILFRDIIVEQDYAYGYQRNKKTNKFVCYNEKKLTFFNETANKEASYDRQYNEIIEACVLNDDRVLILESDKSGEFYVTEFKDGKAESFAIGSEGRKNWAYPRLSVNEATEKVYVSVLLWQKINKDNSLGAAYVATLNLSDLKTASIKEIDFAISSPTPYVVNRGVISDEKSEILCLENQWVTVSTSTSQSSSGRTSTSSSAKTTTGSAVLINFSKEEKNQKWISKAVVSSIHLPKLSSQFILRDGKVYCIYNSMVGARTYLVQSVYDTDLNYLTANYRDTYKEAKLVFHPSHAYELNDGRILFLLQYKTKLAMAKVLF